MISDSERDDIVREFLGESRQNLEQFESTLLEAEASPGARELCASLFRNIHSIKGNCGFLGFSRLEALLHSGEAVLSRLRDGELKLDAALTSALLSMADSVRRLLSAIEESGSESALDLGAAAASLEHYASGAHGEEGARHDSLVAEVAEARPAHDGKIRVDVALLDRLMNLVGELVLARNQIARVAAQQALNDVVLPAQRLNIVTAEIQEAVMKARMQPISAVWSRFPRLARDLALASDRRVRLEMDGRETELDKTVIEAVQDPLTHLVRNAIAHGIEPPEARLRQGKPAVGTLALRAFHEGGMVNIEVSDDGAGVDVGKVKRRAVELELIGAEQAARLSDRDALGLLFLPGFSTSERVTTVSGRGVGMDVVRTNVEKIGGSVDVHSESGRSTTIKLKIPLTLAIIPALIVTSGARRYAMPQASLLEVVRLDGEQLRSELEVVQGAPVFKLRGKLLPLAFLSDQLGEPRRERDSLFILVLRADERTFGLAVDDIRDTEEIVVKPLWKRLKGLAIYAGATVMGDGTVALILDALGLAQRIGLVDDGRQQAALRSEHADSVSAEETEAALLCRLPGDGRVAIPLAEVARLEQLPRSSVERVGGANLAQYRGQILPVVWVADALEERRSKPRAAPESPSEAVSLVVCAQHERTVGFAVEAILDIVVVRRSLEKRAARRGVLGSMVIQGRITEFLDVEALVRHAESAHRSHDEEGQRP